MSTWSSAWRSPGSTLKPFLYGMAIDDGMIHSESLLIDAPQSVRRLSALGNFDAAFNGPMGVGHGAATVVECAGCRTARTRRARSGLLRGIDHAGIALKFPQ
jgi:penicillin-binding protein 1C